MLQEKIYLNFFGVAVEISGDNREIMEELRRDFAYFVKKSGSADFSLTVSLTAPPYQQIPAVTASMYLSQSIAYDCASKRYVDYKSRALSILDYKANQAEVYSPEPGFLHEISYLLILSRVGELLDRKGMHRIHGLGISVDGKAVVCLLPMGAGKTTLALGLLKSGNAKLLSDDILLVDKSGNFLPFPLRVGVDKKNEDLGIPVEYLREFNRSQYGPKILIDVEYFKARLAEPSRPWIILVGSRKYCRKSTISPKNRLFALKYLARDCVVGIGLPQMIEYFFRARLMDLLSKSAIAFRRLLACVGIMLKSRVYLFELGIDKDDNTQALLNFLQKMSANSRV